MSTEDLAPAFAALDECAAALTKLAKTCCEPDRSPRMAALGKSLDIARGRISQVTADPTIANVTFDGLEDAGAQIGRLQVACCAPNRMPLYEKMLDGLNTVQLTVTKALGQGH